MNITHDTVVTVIVTAVLTCLLLVFFYERELGKMQQQLKTLSALYLDRTYDWLSARAEASTERDLRWSFSDALHEHVGNGVTNKDLAPLFDQDLMKGNHD